MKLLLTLLISLVFSSSYAEKFECLPSNFKGEINTFRYAYRVYFSLEADELNINTILDLDEVLLTATATGGHGSWDGLYRASKAFKATHPVYLSSGFIVFLGEYHAPHIAGSARSRIRFNFDTGIHKVFISEWSGDDTEFFMVCEKFE